MRKPIGTELLERVAASEPVGRKLYAIQNAQWPVQFSHVIQAAQPFLTAIIARAWQRLLPDDRKGAASTVWLLCPNVHSQELFYESLLNWQPDALFLPEAEFAAAENVLPDPEIAAERLAVLMHVGRGAGPHVIVTTRASLDQAAPKNAALESAVTQLERGAASKMESLLERLISSGYERVAQVTTRGQFAVRGGIVDLYSWQAPMPFRAEFSGDQIESLREFDIDTQTSVRDLKSVDVLLNQAALDQSSRVRDYIDANDLKVDIEPEETSTAQIQVSEGWIETGPEDFSGAFQDCEIGEFGVGDLVLAEAKRAQFTKRLREWHANDAKIVIYFQTEGEIERFREIMAAATDGIDFVEGTLARGFCFPAANLVVLSAAELFGRFATHTRRRLRRAERHRAQIDFSELNEGDLVVHLEHGIGRFLGLQRIPVGQAHRLPDADGTHLASGALALQQQGQPQEVLVLEFADEAKLYVPLEQAYLVSRYVGAGKKSPTLSSLGDGRWARAKVKAAASIFDYAGKMLAVQAERQTHAGYAFAPDTKWQTEFEHSFPFRETPDQMKAIIDTKIDMERSRPMDRLICGDVGFGKTEVAVRAAFKAVMDGKQVAVLAPTTVLAQQHFEVFRQRMLDYPVRIEMLSRFRSQSEQKKVLQLLREGGVDIVIGTHRLISGDVVFKDLALVVIDEEQRFGVLHKEKFKELFKLVDVLTLSATPIPRTLYL
ncbi:MAG TPA: DEAD/DEAH box helicase, partial [Candidatus Udaeobacter sp.]